MSFFIYFATNDGHDDNRTYIVCLFREEKSNQYLHHRLLTFFICSFIFTHLTITAATTTPSSHHHYTHFYFIHTCVVPFIFLFYCIMLLHLSIQQRLFTVHLSSGHITSWLLSILLFSDILIPNNNDWSRSARRSAPTETTTKANVIVIVLN